MLDYRVPILSTDIILIRIVAPGSSSSFMQLQQQQDEETQH